MKTIQYKYLIFIVLSSCNYLDPVGITVFKQQLENTDQNIVIQGGITTQIRKHAIDISVPTMWSGTTAKTPSIEKIFVYNGLDTIYYHHQKENHYVAEIPFRAQPDLNYTLTVILKDGTIVQATDKITNTQKDTIELSDIEQFVHYTYPELSMPRHIYLRGSVPAIWGVNLPIPNQQGIWTFQEKTPIENLEELTYSHMDVTLQGLFASYTESYTFYVSSDSVELIRVIPSNAYYSYLVDVFNETDWSMGIFSTIQGNVIGNVTNAYGFFYVAQETRSKIAVNSLINNE